jgi:hypothetical protein
MIADNHNHIKILLYFSLDSFQIILLLGIGFVLIHDRRPTPSQSNWTNSRNQFLSIKNQFDGIGISSWKTADPTAQSTFGRSIGFSVGGNPPCLAEK